MRTLVEPVRLIRAGRPQVFLRPEANLLLEQAIARYGKPIYPTGAGSAGRSREQQQHYWNVYQNGGPIASHPDRGPNPHMRYGAIDISDYDARQAMLAVGWVATTPSEWWHFEHPDCRSWPIVTETYLASPEPERDEDFMPFNIVKASTLKAGKHVAGTLCATVGGYPVGFDEYVRKPGSDDDRAPLMGKQYGPHEPVTDAVWAEMRARYTPSTVTGSGASAEQVADEFAERLRE